MAPNMPFVSKATPADSVKSASSSPGERGERRNADHSAMSAGSEVGNGHCKGGTGVTGKGSPPKDGTRPATEKSKRSKDVDVESGIAVYCDDGAGKRTFATLRFDASRETFVCSIKEEGDVVTDYSVNDFCQIAGAQLLPDSRHTNGDHPASSSSQAPLAPITSSAITVVSSGKPVDWPHLEKAAAASSRLAPPSATCRELPTSSSRHGGPQGGAAGGDSKRIAGASRNSTHAKSSGGSAAAKRRRDGAAGVCESDSDSDGEVAWAKARKQSEYLEGVEKQEALQETYKQRRSAEQAALNQRFFETRHKKEEPILGVDINAPLLHESMFACAEELSILERGCGMHQRLIEKNEETEDDRQKHEQWVARYNLIAESERLQKVSREFTKSGKIHVNMYTELAHATGENYSATITEKWCGDFHAVAWFKMPKVEVEVAPPALNANRSRCASGGNNAGRGSSSRGEASVGNGCTNSQEAEMGGAAYEPSLEPEEVQFFQALFACYGLDYRSICRLLCRPDAFLEVQERVAEATADIRCEVCRNPEGEDLMILCDSCDKGYHIFCLDPPLTAIPEGDWFCENCIMIQGSSAHTHAAKMGVHEPAESNGCMVAPNSPPSKANGRVLQLEGLELKAQQELEQSVADGEWNTIVKLSVLQNASQCNSNAVHLPEGRLRIDDIQQSPNTSIFSSMLFTCPVPTRCDGGPMAEVVTVPLRRHLRIIHAAVIAAFTAMHANLIKQGDAVYIWKTGSVELKDSGLWEPVTGGLVAMGSVRLGPEVQALPAAIAAYLRPAGRQLDPWKDTMSCRVDVSHVFKEMLSASKLRAELQGQGAALPIFENAVGSVYRLTTAQMLAVEEIVQRHDPSLSSEAPLSASGSSVRGQYYHMLHHGDRKDKTSVLSQRRSLNAADSSTESDGNDLYEEDKEGDAPATGERERRPMWMNQTGKLLQKLKRHSDAKPFLLPVNTCIYPDYPEVLSRHSCSPISLADIEDNLESGQYRSHRELLADIRRIWKNCQVYNPEKDPMQLMATNMSQYSDLLWAKDKQRRNKRRRDIEEQRNAEGVGKGEHAAGEEGGGEEEEEEERGGSTQSMDLDEPCLSNPPEEKKRENQEEKNACDGNDGKEAGRCSDTGITEEAGRCSDTGITEEQLRSSAADAAAAALVLQMQCRICSKSGNTRDNMIVCSVSGAPFHLACIQEPPVLLLDGPYIAARELEGLDEWQLPRAPDRKDNMQVTAAGRPCGVCRERRESLAMQSCAGCYARYHTACLATLANSSSRPLNDKDDKFWLCTNCHSLLPPPERRTLMLRALARREVVYECRRLMHLHCELCSRDREFDMEHELHPFRISKQLVALAKRIFDYNSLLMKEANALLEQTSAFSG